MAWCRWFGGRSVDIEVVLELELELELGSFELKSAACKERKLRHNRRVRVRVLRPAAMMQEFRARALPRVGKEQCV